MAPDNRPLTVGEAYWCVKALRAGFACTTQEDVDRLIDEMIPHMPSPESARPTDAPAIPPNTLEGMEGYVKRGEDPGGFLRAVFANHLVYASRCADKQNMAALQAIANWVCFNTPKPAFGSCEKVHAWIREHEDARLAVQAEGGGEHLAIR